MAVYTYLSELQIADLLQHYDIGELVTASAIAQGVENSNYLLHVERAGEAANYILTIYERRVAEQDLPFFLELMQHLAAKGRNCPLPIIARDGSVLQSIVGKKAAIISFMQGKDLQHNDIKNIHISALGAEMAKLHNDVVDFNKRRDNSLSPANFANIYDKIASHIDSIDDGLSIELERELRNFESWPNLGLPVGVIHGDLFPDNVFFIADKVSAIIDFYFACDEYLAYDLAIAMNAWCFTDPAGMQFDMMRAHNLLQAYDALRPVSSEELELLPLLLRAAAVRFILTRAYDWFFSRKDAVVTPKDPLEYVCKWRVHKKMNSKHMAAIKGDIAGLW